VGYRSAWEANTTDKRGLDGSAETDDGRTACGNRQEASVQQVRNGRSLQEGLPEGQSVATDHGTTGGLLMAKSCTLAAAKPDTFNGSALKADNRDPDHNSARAAPISS
jgi:hypothetical protein